MPDLKISELPVATNLADTDIAALVQGSGPLVTRRASVAQLRSHLMGERGVHIRDFGAVGNGSADDGPALQAAINALTPSGGTVLLGARTYRIGTPVVISSAAVRIQGQGFSEGGNPGEGTWLTCTTPGIFPITITGVAARGSAVRDLAVRESHYASHNGSWAPTPYEWFFRVLDCLGGADFDNVMLAPVNKGILVKNSGRTDIRRLRGQVFTAGVEYDEIYDAARISSLHFWPFWSSNDNVVRWQQANTDCLVFRRVDGVFVDQAFVLGARSMFRFSSSAAGYTQKFSIGQAYADFVRHGLWLEASGTDGQVDALSVQCEIFNAGGAPLPGSVGILIGANGCRVQMGQLRIDDVEDHAIRMDGIGSRLDIGALRVVNYNQRNIGAAAVMLANAANGQINRVNLGGAPLLEGITNNGPLVNAATNGACGMLAAAGSPARPGLAVGSVDAGLSQPVANGLVASVAGTEVMRLLPGTALLGGPAGAHGLEVTTPAGAANRLRAVSSAAGSGVTLQAHGSDANVEMALESRGAAAMTLRTGGGTQAQIGHVAGAVNYLLLSGGVTGSPARVVLQAAGADANIHLALVPKGSGGVMGHAPDNAVAGGALRGANAVDWQTSRVAAAQVASGQGATIGGGENNTASGIRSAVGGGVGNTATGANATIAGGSGAIAQGGNSSVGGGNNNFAGGTNGWIPGGAQAFDRGGFGRGAWSAGMFTGLGDAQAGEFVLRALTTDAAAARLTANGGTPGSTNTVNLPGNGTYRLKLLVVAQQTGGSAGTAGDCASWEVNLLARRGAGAATTVVVGGTTFAGASLASVTPGTGIPPGLRDANAAGWLLTIAADTANGALAISGTGEANKTIRWVARLLSAEVTA